MKATTIYNEQVTVFELLGTVAITDKGYIHMTKLFIDGDSLMTKFGETYETV